MNFFSYTLTGEYDEFKKNIKTSFCNYPFII